MIILHGLPANSSKKVRDEDWEEEQVSDPFEERFLEIYENIPEKNFIVFVEPNPDKRTRFYKQIMSIATIKDYQEPTLSQLQKYIAEKLNIDPAAAHLLIQKKKNDIVAIDGELEKLGLYKVKEKVSLTDIESFVSEELENRIFDLLDVLMERHTQKSLHEFEVISNNENIFMIFSSLLSNLRKIIYALLLLGKWISADRISKELGVHPFVIKKNTRHASRVDSLIELYTNLTQREYEAKTGWHPWASEEAMGQMIAAEIVRFCKKP